MTRVSTARHDLTRTRSWVRTGTDQLVRALDPVSDADLDRTSGLPQWSRRHVIAHLARNAEALRRLLLWARTGTVSPMYADTDQRSREIETSAQHDAGQLRRELVDTAEALEADAAALTDQQWSAPVRSARGREIQAVEVPWMRAREVWLHALDLDIGLGVAQLPADFSCTLIDDVVEHFDAAPGAPAVRIACGERTWSIGAGGPLVRGEPSSVAAWLTGRSAGENLAADELPNLPAWL
jgi:maleylpyruvate isomerase